MKGRRNSALAALLLLITSAIACSEQPIPTPTRAFQIYYQAAKDKDAATLKKVLSKLTLERFQRETALMLGEESISLNKLFEIHFDAGALSGFSVPETMPETRDERIDGARATLVVTSDDEYWCGGKPNTFFFAKEEEDRWKLRLDLSNWHNARTFATLEEVLRNKEALFFGALLSKKLLEEADEKAKKQNKPTDVVVGEMMNEFAQRIRDDSFTAFDEEVEDNRLTLEFRNDSTGSNPGEVQRIVYTFVREDGGWKIEDLVREKVEDFLGR